MLAVGFERRPDLLEHLAGLLALPGENARSLLLTLTALHDIGKVATAFQWQNGACRAIARRLGIDPAGVGHYGRDFGHDFLGFVLLRELVRKGCVVLPECDATIRPSDFTPLWATFAGHHGRQPPTGATWREAIGRDQVFEEDEALAARLASEMMQIFGWRAGLPERDAICRTSYFLNGVVTVADWLGSDQRFFPFIQEAMPLDRYWEDHALKGAKQAVEWVGPSVFHRTPAKRALSFDALFAHLAAHSAIKISATPMQAAVEATITDERLPDGPLLLVIEDMTGAGKTEAADLAAHRLIAAGRADGMYVGLPTMATADAAFARKEPIVDRIFTAPPSIVLAHSRARHRTDFKQVESRAMLEPGDFAAVTWLTSSSKRALLADLGVGTIDQALIGALRTPHATVRLAGLWRKVLIVDEVHAFDDYMRALLVALLRYQAAMGGAAILMSATLPSRFRTELVTAFASGAGWNWGEARAAALPSNAFPLLTLAAAAGPVAMPIAHGPARAFAPLAVERVGRMDDVRRRVTEWALTGRSVIWFRNTVDDAIECWEALRTEAAGNGLPDPILYHARFLPADRAVIEAEVEGVAGKHGGPARRKGQIVVATQVAEQSLDLDFDELATDLAPVDVLLQRIGRRRRHARDAVGALASDGIERRSPGAAVVVLAPDPDRPTAEWIRGTLPRSQMIYPDDARLWLSLRLLTEPRLIPGRTSRGPLVPDRDLKPLIEAVYAPSATILSTVPAVLHDRHQKAEGAGLAALERGRDNRLSFTQGLLADWAGGAVQPESDAERLPTRLGDSRRAVLLERCGTSLRLLGSGTGDVALDQSECRCPLRLRPVSITEEDFARLATAGLSRGARDRLKVAPAIVMTRQRDGALKGEVVGDERKIHVVMYDKRKGLFLD